MNAVAHSASSAGFLHAAGAVLAIATILVGFILSARFGSQLYDEAKQDPRREGRYAIVQRRVTRRFIEGLRMRDSRVIFTFAFWIVWALTLLGLAFYL
jgi:hypothetical protein